MGPLLAIFPHPDDETFTAGGTLAAAVDRDLAVTLICATRGEAGESSMAALAGSKLGVVREAELRDAMHHLGVVDVRFLDYRDSGMEGSPEAEHDNAFVRVPIAQVARTLASYIRDIRPMSIITFGPDGIYGHPDHLHLHHAVVAAVSAAADPSASHGEHAAPWHTSALYFATMPREMMLALLDEPSSPLASLSTHARANLGTPRAEITHVINVIPWAERKRAAIVAHRSQTGEGGPLSGVPESVRERQLTHEYFVRSPLPWISPHTETDFLTLLTNSASRA